MIPQTMGMMKIKKTHTMPNGKVMKGASHPKKAINSKTRKKRNKY